MRTLPPDVMRAIETVSRTKTVTLDIYGLIENFERLWIDGVKYGVIQWAYVSQGRIEAVVIELPADEAARNS